ncbi:MAG TPA: indolepyruvate oxidoreductase subunit beta family protein [Caldimonas sp.]|jgi:indolepyruvate ferredoxin oxidoreductase beta subunit|nr:indolepyruvate oxidoreductase subunit beta family protein [Caldimonas sp.]HEX4233625.1 indolepyruvate oxidoreductase subunit beta family protein [Caldimonas sp.]
MAAPLKIAILAMGGEGGGVLADWIVDLGEANGWLAQTTSVPGVAQRTGATIYYVELYPKSDAERDGAEPVLALMPLPGDVDIVLASELMECGRAVQRGLVTPDRTTLIASTHRVYSITEKTALGDGRVASDALLAHARGAAKRFVRFDMAEAAEQAGSVISAVLFGALAGTGVLPFSRARFEATVARGGVGVAPSLKAFDAGFTRAAGAATEATLFERADWSDPGAETATNGMAVAAPAASALDGTTDAPSTASTAARSQPRSPPLPATAVLHPGVRALVERIAGEEFPAHAHALLKDGVRRLIDYQDLAYAGLYLDRIARIAAGPLDASGQLVAETARHLALWMSYEDTARVAQLKTRGERFTRVRSEVRAGADQVLAIDEYLHPRVQEIAETLPASIGRRIERPGWLRDVVERATRRGRIVTTSSLAGFLLLRTVAAMRRWRRATTRHAAENTAIEAWLARIVATAASHPELAVEIARCQRLVKGYSDTHERGVRNFETVMAAVQKGGAALAPATLRELREAALADEHGHALGAVLARHALA